MSHHLTPTITLFAFKEVIAQRDALLRALERIYLMGDKQVVREARGVAHTAIASVKETE